jgi:two-component system invasion response regulator UvrY
MEIKKVRLIIADDHQMVRQAWSMILQNSDLIEVICECTSGTEVIDACLSMDPDIVLMDINMHPVNGFEATRKILKSSPHIKIIGISINNQPAYAKNIMQLGAKGYVTKNSSKEEMLKAINEVMCGNTYICDEVSGKMK